MYYYYLIYLNFHLLYLDYYLLNQANTYGSINDKNQCLDLVLTRDEKQIYEQIQQSDKDRLRRFS